MHVSGPDILLVRGAPGVGKSTAVARLRKQMVSGAIVEVDALRGMIVGVEWRNKDQHMVALEHARLLAESFLERGSRPIVIVDTLGRARFEAFTPALTNSFRVASLYATPEILTGRVTLRPDGQFKDLEACLVLNAEMRNHRYPAERLVDTTEMTPDAVAAVLLSELAEAPA